MGSRKPSAKVRQINEFKAGLDTGEESGLDSYFDLEERRQREQARDREEFIRAKACESKNRYETRADAEASIAACEEHGATGLRVYQCRFCGGWHLTSMPHEDESHPSWQRG